MLAGTDSRAGTGNEYGGDLVQGERSDTTILAHLDADGTYDADVDPPRHPGHHPGLRRRQGHRRTRAHQDKFNSAIMLGGPSLMVRTVEELTGIRVDHYVSVDLAGFKQITDAIGGVTSASSRRRVVETSTNDNGTARIRSTNLDDPFSGFQGKVGSNHLNGDQALAFVRQRHGLRAATPPASSRQQQFLGAGVPARDRHRRAAQPGRG